MSLKETSELIAKSRKIIDSGTENADSVLNMILCIVTNIETGMKKMNENIDKKIDELNNSILGVSSSVRKLENDMTEINKKFYKCEESCQGVSNLFDGMNSQVKTNTRNIIHRETHGN